MFQGGETSLCAPPLFSTGFCARKEHLLARNKLTFGSKREPVHCYDKRKHSGRDNY